ncbi:MAG: 4Fe-4S binding protein [Acholeplasmataceae bacterium]|nr:4Fe-4S binding protein [Acholeplasmataceae bacterium]
MKIVHGYFSPNGETKKIANIFYDELGGKLIDLTYPQSRVDHRRVNADLYILSLPVYSQNIPRPLRKFLIHIKAPFVFINLTYGGFSYGNVLFKIKKQLRVSRVVGYTVSPVKHAYIDQNLTIDKSAFDSSIKKLQSNILEEIHIPYRFNHIFASLFEKSRTRHKFKLNVNLNMCTQCNICIKECPTGSITQSIKILDSCISCEHCVHVCPENAITSKKSFLLKHYLKKNQKTSVIVR